MNRIRSLKRIGLYICLIMMTAAIPLVPPQPYHGDERPFWPGSAQIFVNRFDRTSCSQSITVTGGVDFVAAVGQAVAFLRMDDPPACKLVAEHIDSIRTSPDTLDAMVSVRTAEILFPEHWDYREMDREKLADILVREAVHVWLYRNDYRFEEVEEDPYGIERLVRRYILLNREEPSGHSACLA